MADRLRKEFGTEAVLDGAHTSPSVMLPAVDSIPYKVGLACSGLGRVARGLESFTKELHSTLDDPNILLFAGKKTRDAMRAVEVPHVPRDAILRLVPHCSWEKAYRWEQLTFGLGLFPFLVRQNVRVLHFSDLAIAGSLLRLRNMSHYRLQLVFSNGGGYSPDHLRRADFIHVVTPLQAQEACRMGIDPARLFCIPYGVFVDDFCLPSKLHKKSLRDRFGVPHDAFVILGVGPPNPTKRLDWTIREVAKLADRNVFLLLVGAHEPGASTIESLANSHLGGKSRVLWNVPQADMTQVISLSDAFVSASLAEAFGRSIIEAASARVPAIVHDNAHFRWLLAFQKSFVDMRVPGQLSNRLLEFMDQPRLREMTVLVNRRHVKANFDWSALRSSYLGMYSSIAKRALGPLRGNGRRHPWK